MPGLRDVIYGARRYSELKMKLSLMGLSPMSEGVFDACQGCDWMWEGACSVMEDLVDAGMDGRDVDRLITAAVLDGEDYGRDDM